MKDAVLEEIARSEVAMGHLGKLTSLKDLPADKKLTAYIKEAMQLNDLGTKIPSKTKSAEAKKLVVPDILLNALKKNKKAFNTFENFSTSHKKEYTEWISGAKTEDTRIKRLATTMEWLEAGKIRNWKYVKKK